MNVLVLAVTWVSRAFDTCAALVDMRAAAERQVFCPRCGRVRRAVEHPIAALVKGTASPLPEDFASDACPQCGWTPDDGDDQPGYHA
jgi:hypothetical protein